MNKSLSRTQPQFHLLLVLKVIVNHCRSFVKTLQRRICGQVLWFRSLNLVLEVQNKHSRVTTSSEDGTKSVVAVLRLHFAYWLGTLARRMFALKNEIKAFRQMSCLITTQESAGEWESKRKAIKVGSVVQGLPAWKVCHDLITFFLNSFEVISKQAVCLGNWNSHARMRRELLQKSFFSTIKWLRRRVSRATIRQTCYAPRLSAFTRCRRFLSEWVLIVLI